MFGIGILLLLFGCFCIASSELKCANCIEDDVFSHVAKDWCNVHPKVQLIVEEDNNSIYKDFPTYISQLSRKANGVSFHGVGGGKLTESYVFCHDGKDYTCNVWDNSKHVSSSSYFKQPSAGLRKAKCDTTITTSEDLLLFTNFFSDNFGHFLHDNMPGMLFLYAMREKVAVSRTAKLLVPYNPVSTQFFEWVFRGNVYVVATDMICTVKHVIMDVMIGCAMYYMTCIIILYRAVYLPYICTHACWSIY